MWRSKGFSVKKEINYGKRATHKKAERYFQINTSAEICAKRQAKDSQERQGVVDADTIVAISTPVGEGAIGIVRMSGKGALKIADKIFSAKDRTLASKLESHVVSYGWIIDRKSIIDEVLLTVMRSPRTYTREDIVEINCHGGIVALQKILEIVINCGARLAEPGEFTKRAFLNGRIDLSKAEAVLDIIKAKTDTALKLGIEQLSGNLSNKIKKLRSDLIEILANIEADIDFSEEDIETKARKILFAKLDRIIKELDIIIQDSKKVSFFKEGIKVTICGRPNVGKSSLLNALLRKERAIVTPIAGTTRDIIEEFINLGGIGIRLVDTAGMIKPRDLIDHHAIKLAKDSIALSDIVLLVFDASQKLTKKDIELIKELKHKDVIVVLNKIDLVQKIEENRIRKEFNKIVKISSLKSENIDKLEKAISSFVYKGKIISSEGLITSNARQQQEIRHAKELLEKAKISFKENISLEFMALDLKLALDNLGRIIGETIDDKIIDKIFSEFCIGK